MNTVSKPEKLVNGNYKVFVINEKTGKGKIVTIEKKIEHEFKNGYSNWEGKVWRTYWSYSECDIFTSRKDCIESLKIISIDMIVSK